MSEPEGPILIPVPPKKSSASVWLLLLILLVLAGYGGWRAYEWAVQRLGLASDQQELLTRLSGEVQALRVRTEGLANQQTELNTRIEGDEQWLGRLSETLEGGRTRVQLAAVEQLLLLANDRLLLARDFAGARLALEQADRRLGALNDPRLLKVREALAQERSALSAIAEEDTTGSALRLAELIRNAPRFPLHARVIEHFETIAVTADVPADGEGSAQRIWGAVKGVLSNIFSLRRAEGPPPRLLPPGEGALVAQALLLKLEGARLALMARDHEALRDLANGARDWLRDYYKDNDPAVKAAQAELEQLAQLGSGPAAPDISRSLSLLRDYLSVAAR